MCEPPEMGYRLRNRQGISFSLTDEFIVTLKIFYDDDFDQQFSPNSSGKWVKIVEIKRFSFFRAISISKVALLILCRKFILSEKKKQDFEKLLK